MKASVNFTSVRLRGGQSPVCGRRFAVGTESAGSLPIVLASPRGRTWVRATNTIYDESHQGGRQARRIHTSEFGYLQSLCLLFNPVQFYLKVPPVSPGLCYWVSGYTWISCISQHALHIKYFHNTETSFPFCSVYFSMF